MAQIYLPNLCYLCILWFLTCASIQGYVREMPSLREYFASHPRDLMRALLRPQISQIAQICTTHTTRRLYSSDAVPKFNNKPTR